jgi:mycothiol synthase
MTQSEYAWREAGPADLAGLTALDDACFRADGPELVGWGAYTDHIAAPGSSIACAVTPGGDVVGVAWARLENVPAMLGGKIHPDHRRRGLGSQAIRWAEDRARGQGRPGAVMIRNEAITEGAQALYQREGYTADFFEYWMNRDLAAPLPKLPGEVRLETWSDRNVLVFYDTFTDSFRDRGGPRESAVKWISWNKDEEDFRSDLCLLAYVDGQPAAFVTAGPLQPVQFDTPIGWIVQMGVRPEWRGRGIADGLIGEIGRRFRSEGFATLGLDVNLNNPRAMRVYERNGFSVVGKRAKFSKMLE